MTLIQDEAHRLFEYRDGMLFWKVRPLSDFTDIGSHKRWNSRSANKQAGSCAGIYANVSINKVRYQIHRVVFLMHHGFLPQVSFPVKVR